MIFDIIRPLWPAHRNRRWLVTLTLYHQVRKTIKVLKRGETSSNPKYLLKGEKAVFLCLAVAAERNDGTGIFCGVPYIMEVTGYSRWWVQQCLRKLERLGWITADSKVGGRGHPTSYRMPLDDFGHIFPAPPADQVEADQVETSVSVPIRRGHLIDVSRTPSPPAPAAAADSHFLDIEEEENSEDLERQIRVTKKLLNMRQRRLQQLQQAPMAPPASQDIQIQQSLLKESQEKLDRLLQQQRRYAT